jgi:hypothetical protein
VARRWVNAEGDERWQPECDGFVYASDVLYGLRPSWVPADSRSIGPPVLLRSRKRAEKVEARRWREIRSRWMLSDVADGGK